MLTTRTPSATTLSRIRECFPSLATPTALLENAGGSQVPAAVADAIREYMTTSYVQLEAGYPESDRADAVVEGAHDFVSRLMNGHGTGTVVLGSSTSQLVTMLAGCYADTLEPGDEIIVAETGHEANVGPWLKLADRGLKVRIWPVDPERMACTTDALSAIMTPRTKVVAFVHTSNLLGEIVDLAPIVAMTHDAGARVVVDGVAFAPHRAMDVAAWDVDWYVYSTYKVYGPHMAALYGRADAMAELTGPNHFFIPREETPYKFELGGVNHESCAGVQALAGYLAFLASLERGDDRISSPTQTATVDRPAIEDAFALMTACEAPLQDRLVGWLKSRSGVRIIGPDHGDVSSRVGTVSFVHATKSSREIVAAAHAGGVGIRNGHMYAHRLCTALGIEPEDGVVRVSLVHYNNEEEIERLVGALEGVL